MKIKFYLFTNSFSNGDFYQNIYYINENGYLIGQQVESDYEFESAWSVGDKDFDKYFEYLGSL